MNTLKWLIFAVGLTTSLVANAETRLAISEFELNDVTALPGTPAEIKRTAALKPMLEQALAEYGGYRIAAIADSQAAASSPGYWFTYDEAAVALARQSGADWVVVNRHSKPSFLFSYLMSHLINVQTGQRVAGFSIEMKGTHETVTRHGIAALAKKITEVIADYRQP